MIQKEVLLTYGAVYKRYKAGEILFMEGDTPRYYFEVVEGCVKVLNINDEGRSFVQGMFWGGESFGEPVLFIDEPYPATAMAHSDCLVFRIIKEDYLKMVHDFPKIMESFIKLLSRRLYHKTIISRELSGYGPEHRVMTILETHKKRSVPDSNLRCMIELTRQQIADLAGLRVETVIRTVKEMEKKGLLEIKDRKVFL